MKVRYSQFFANTSLGSPFVGRCLFNIEGDTKIVIIDILDRYNLMKVVNIFDELRSKLIVLNFSSARFHGESSACLAQCHPTS
jgi:hypothetical protein